MSIIQSLIGELKHKLTHQARQDLDRLIASPEAQSVLKRDEEALLAQRSELVDALRNLPSKYEKIKVEKAKPVAAAVARVDEAERELVAAKANLILLRALANAPVAQENTELFQIEKHLLEGCDQRLDLFRIHVENALNIVGNCVVVWPSNIRNWITGERSVVYESNNTEVRSTMKLLSEAAADCRAMRLEAISFSDVSSRLHEWSERMRDPLLQFNIQPPRIDENGEVKLNMVKMSSTERIEQALSTSKGIGKRALS